MQSTIQNNRHFLRIDRGEEIVETITNYIQEQNITAGSIQAIGAAENPVLGFYDVEKKQYFSKSFEGDYEITNISGNISTKEGKLWPHLHMTISDINFAAFGGHLEKATVAVTCEVIIEPVDMTIERQFDEETGLQLWQL